MKKFKDIFIIEYKLKTRNILIPLTKIFTPFILYFLIYFAISNIFKSETDNYKLFLLIGITKWYLISNVFFEVLLYNKRYLQIISSVNIPHYAIPLSVAFFEYLISLIQNLIILLFFLNYNQLNIYFGFIFVFDIITVFFIFSFAYIFSVYTIIYYDIERIFNLAFTVLFFISPVIYSIKTTDIPFIKLLYLNPLTFVLNGYRDFLLNSSFSINVLISFLLSLTAIYLVKKFNYKKVISNYI